MQSSSCSAQPAKPRRFDVSRRPATLAGPRSRGVQKEDKNMNTITSASPRRVTRGPVAPPRTRPAVQPRAPLSQSRFGPQKASAAAASKSTKPKPKSVRANAATKMASSLPPPPAALPLDPNCNEPSLPCLCCDGRSPQDSNSMFNHNHNNNNTVSLRRQLQLPPPPPAVVPLRPDGTGAKEPPTQVEAPVVEPVPQLDAKADDDKKDVKSEEDDDESSSGDIDIDDEDDGDGDRDDDDDDDTLVPSCCDCPPSLLEFSLSSSTSSSSTSISSCSDLESDCADAYAAQKPSVKDSSPESQPPARSLPALPLGRGRFAAKSHTPISSPDEGYPSALDTPSPDYLGVRGDAEATKLGLLDFLESVGEFGKMERFSQVIQVARWDLEGEQNWDVLRDRLDHLDRLEKVNREVKLFYIARLHEKGFDLGDLEERDLSDVMDEMGNIDIGWKLYKTRGGFMGDSQEFSDAGVDLNAPSDCDDPLAPDSLTPSPAEPPPRPPKPPARHASVNSDLHTYINISRETTSMALTTPPTLSTFSPNSSSPTFSTFRAEKPLPLSPPSIPPLPVSKPVPYLTLYTASSPSVPTPTPPIPPPRRRHLARKEAQRLAALQVEQEKTPLSLPPPTTRPPPLPPPPVISSSLPPPSVPPPALPPPPSFHALDVEIRKLLMLAGLTQAELLKLSPELGDCVGTLEDVDGEAVEFRLTEEDGWSAKSKPMRDPEAVFPEEVKTEAQRTTSFSEMARRRKKNANLTSDAYYSTSFSTTYDAKSSNVESCRYAGKALHSPAPPPPPRPLPPIPPSVPPLKVSTLKANSAQPERFDWLIAFTPDGDAPPQTPEMRKAHKETAKKTPPPPKVTSFKELRHRGKSGAPATRVIMEPDPDPTVITPDPDILYNLKWRREKEGSGGSQWEYTSQAQALFMQPPPALTSMAALKEMLQRADQESGKRSDKMGCSVSDSSLWTMSREWERQDATREKERREDDEAEVRGQADGGRTLDSRTAAVRSVSFGGAAQRGEASWMGEDVPHPMRGLGLSSLHLLEKRALVSAVSVAVEAVLAQFSSSRTVVQKALSGDSTVNPSLGRLVLQCLCPALHSLLTDGLKPHQSDLIAGRRPTSAWSLVQASTRPGPKTQTLFNLQARVGELPQLKQNKHRFNAFLLGLLNSKQLDFWVSHVQSCRDVLDAYYRPTAFMRLSLTACQPLFDELLLVLQPLGLLTFNLDLLFQHHHLDPHGPAPKGRGQDAGAKSSRPGTRGAPYTESLSEVDFVDHQVPSAATPSSGGSVESIEGKTPPTLSHTSPQLMWVQEKRIGELPPPNLEEESLAQQAGQVIQQGWGAVMRWGGRLSQNLAELNPSAGSTVPPDHRDQSGGDFAPVGFVTQVPWGLGRLFGAAPKSPNSPVGHASSSRRPSQWLAPGVTALTRMVSSAPAPMLRKTPEPREQSQTSSEGAPDTPEMTDRPKSHRSVRTLCDHAGTGSELSFCRGEELVVLGGVDQDWIRCRQGDREGLVPIGYTSLIM
uniref:uncharacterized protein rusc1 isoform X2 n=1 Tax=Doryrhamphus excisus TaxID=161450 RepID=UPI0025AE44BF|nr:uncharacterized protein rusc1 isoform X2 [Doryrhamphus excisus]